jgi:hypothetical protein
MPLCVSCSWRLLGTAASLASSLDVPPWQPRVTVQLSQLSRPRDIGAEVDFNGALVWAGDVNTGVWVCVHRNGCGRGTACW